MAAADKKQRERHDLAGDRAKEIARRRLHDDARNRGGVE
jgi:hypothetical protein